MCPSAGKSEYTEFGLKPVVSIVQCIVYTQINSSSLTVGIVLINPLQAVNIIKSEMPLMPLTYRVTCLACHEVAARKLVTVLLPCTEEVSWNILLTGKR